MASPLSMASELFLYKPWRVTTLSKEFSDGIAAKCPGGHEHGQCRGDDCKHTENYTPAMVKQIHCQWKIVAKSFIMPKNPIRPMLFIVPASPALSVSSCANCDLDVLNRGRTQIDHDPQIQEHMFACPIICAPLSASRSHFVSTF